MSTGPTPSAGVGDRPGALPPGLDVVGAVQGDDPQARKPRTSSKIGAGDWSAAGTEMA